MSDFDIEFELAHTGDGNVLTPLAIPNFRNAKASKPNNASALCFDIKVKTNPLDTLTVTISNTSKTVLQTTLPSTFNGVGEHRWEWDGHDSSGVLDTRALKQSALSFTVTGTRQGTSKSALLNVAASAAEQDWVDAVVNRSTKTAEVELRVEVKDGGGNGVGESPPKQVQGSPSYKNYPASDPRKQKHTRAMSFQSLRQLMFSGITTHWSRNITDAAGNTYSLTVKPQAASKQAMDDIKLVYNTNRSWMRSSNPGSVRGVISLFGNFVPERIAYNVGWVEYSNGWYFEKKSDADLEFAETAAHEVGHEILSAYGGENYSYGHKGSSTVVTQKRKPVASGGVAFPNSGEIDIMKYYNGNKPKHYFPRVKASEQDAKSLLWLSRLRFRAQ